jgi:hypothetical protein
MTPDGLCEPSHDFKHEPDDKDYRSPHEENGERHSHRDEQQHAGIGDRGDELAHGRSSTPTAWVIGRASVVQHDTEEGAVDFQTAVVVDEPELSELVHEEVHTRPRRPDHLRERFLRQHRKHPLRRILLAVPC